MDFSKINMYMHKNSIRTAIIKWEWFLKGCVHAKTLPNSYHEGFPGIRENNILKTGLSCKIHIVILIGIENGVS